MSQSCEFVIDKMNDEYIADQGVGVNFFKLTLDISVIPWIRYVMYLRMRSRKVFGNPGIVYLKQVMAKPCPK